MERRIAITVLLGCLFTSVFTLDCLFENVAKLAKYDAKLYSRHDEKWNLIRKGESKSNYLKVMQNIKSSGRTFACGYTRGWVAEILQGLSAQYDEFKVKNASGWPAAGFVNATGQKIITIFNSNLASTKRILYKFQIVGPLDHVWLVEQLANGGGYRVYQSYNNAYSLKAWLSTGNLKAMHGTDIIIWHDVIKMADNMLKMYGGSLSDLNNLPARFKAMKPWLMHIRDYNLTQVEAEFRKAWSVIGQGRIMSKDYFYKNYLKKLANLTEFIIPYVNTAKLWPRNLHELWTELFGAPNPVLYPGYPFNNLTARYSQNYALEMKQIVVDSAAEALCPTHSKVLLDSVSDCFFDNVKRLSHYDELLYSRNDEKALLVKSGATLSKFLAIMKNIKSSGQTFACGYTRSWISEILQGLPSQYSELKTKFANGTLKAGFLNVTGQKIVTIFNSNLASTKRILYKFQIVGPLDHVWLVEQLPYGGGYRVYQSYNNAYSLKAWLSTGNLKAMHGTDIIIWHDVIKMADNMLKMYGGSLSDLNNLPARFKAMKPWLMHIRDYNLTQVEAEFRKAWSVIGQGTIMSKDYFYKNYLKKLANLTEFILPYVNTAKLWPRNLHELWTELFGAPNPVLYPGYPFNNLTARYSQNYALEMKQIVVDSAAEALCPTHSKVLLDSVMDCFFDTVKKLSWFDRLLNSRLEDKNRLIKAGTAKEKWLKTMKTIKSSGKTYSCGFTRSWVSEVLQGLSNQYTELTHRNNSGMAAAGFVNVTGSKVVDLFRKNIGSSQRILYKFQIVGPLDHVWLVEQLPFGGGYRVYQSYNNAYSLKAWLAKKDHKRMHGSDIIIWHDVIKMASQYLKAHGGSMSDLNNLPGSVCAMKPWLVFIQDYNLTQVEANLKMAWSKFGQGKIHNRDYFFKNYLYVLGNLTQDIVPFVSTTKKWTKALHDQWTSLFGSPNPVLFPDFPFNQLTAQYSQNYALQVKELKILASNQPVKGAMEEAFCTENGNILEKSLHCFFDGVKELSAYDKKMNSRYDEKKRLVKNAVNESEFIRKMDNFEPVDKTFAGKYTSNWIEEILRGLPAQFNDLQQESKGNMSGFKNITGNQLLGLFNRNAGSWKRILYHFRITSYVENVWLVEQLAYGKGYRLYMSNMDAFSLKAWLSKASLSNFSKRDVYTWTHAKERMMDYIVRHPSPSPSKPLLASWSSYVLGYNMTHVTQNLETARDVFGKGMIVSKTMFFNQYLPMLMKLTDSITTLIGTANPWTRELQQIWIKLFGTANPAVYPDLPYNTFSGAAQKHPLAVRVFMIDELTETKCPAHMSVLRRFLNLGKTTSMPFTTRLTTLGKDPAAGATGIEPAITLTFISTLLAFVYYL